MLHNPPDTPGDSNVSRTDGANPGASISHARALLPTQNTNLPFRASDFSTMAEALDYAARGETGLNFFSARGTFETPLSYKSLRDQARTLAGHLAALPLERGDRVGIVAEMSPDFVIAFFACQYAGLLAVPLPPMTALGGRLSYEKQLRRVVHTSGSRVLLGPEPVHASLNTASEAQDILFCGTVADLMNTTSEAPLRDPLGPEEDSHIQYSSGSTRKPLGILISQKALMANARAMAIDGLKFVAGDRASSWLPFYHDMGLIGFLLIPVTCQITVDYLQTDGFARRPLQWLDIISANRCTIAFSPGFGYDICARRGQRNTDVDLDLQSWRIAGIGGEMVHPGMLQDFAETFAQCGFDPSAFMPSYGLAEATLGVSFSPLGEGVKTDLVDNNRLRDQGVAAPVPETAPNSRIFARCGYPMAGYRICICDENGAELSERRVGHINVSGPSLMHGYFEDPEATAEVMTPDGWLRTGDMGYMIQGELVITGRAKDLIIINGRNIWPQDLEWHAENEVAELRPRDTAAFSMEDSKGKECAVILAHCRVSDKEARDRLRHEIHAAIYRNAGIDARIALIPPGSLPFTTSGKLSRSLAKKSYLRGELAEITGDSV